MLPNNPLSVPHAYYPDYYNHTTASTASNYSTASQQHHHNHSHSYNAAYRRNNNNTNRNLNPDSSHNHHVTSPTSSTSSNSTATTAVSRHAASTLNSPPQQNSSDLLSPLSNMSIRSSSPMLYRSSSFNSNASSSHLNTNIYIRGLLPNTTDDWLYDLTKSYGTIVSHKAIIDLHTSLCKGYGFVMYSTESEAISAMEALAKLGYQVSFAKVRPSTTTAISTTPSGGVNLSASTTSASTATSPTSSPNPTASQSMFGPLPLVYGLAPHGASMVPSTAHTAHFNLPPHPPHSAPTYPHMNSSNLIGGLAGAGSGAGVVAPMFHPQYIMFSGTSPPMMVFPAAAPPLEAAAGGVVGGIVGGMVGGGMRGGGPMADSPESFNARLKNLQDDASTNIYLSNLPPDMTEEQLAQLFLPLAVTSTKILRDPITFHSRGVGFVRLENREDAQTAIERFHSTTLAPGAPPLQVRFADTAAQKRLKNSHVTRKRSNGSNSGGFGGNSRDHHNRGGGSSIGGDLLPRDGFIPYPSGMIPAQAPPGYFPVPIPVPTPPPGVSGILPNMVPVSPPGAGPYMQYPTAIYMQPQPGTSPVPIPISAPVPSPYGSPYAPIPGHLLVPPFYQPGVYSSAATSTAGSDAGGGYNAGGSDIGDGAKSDANAEDEGDEVYYEGDDLDEVHRVAA